MLGEELRLPLDAAGYSRRACPRCEAEFKVRWTRRDAHALAAALAIRVDHLNGAEATPGLTRHCPYCGATGPPELWWTLAQHRWLEARAADLRDELRWRTLRVPLDALRENPRPTYVPVVPRRRRSPTAADDPDELEPVPLPCCGEEVKVSRGWIGPVRCHFCGFVHARSAARDIGLELAALREWVPTR